MLTSDSAQATSLRPCASNERNTGVNLAALSSDPLFNLINFAIAVISVILAVYLYIRGLDRVTLQYQTTERTILEQRTDQRPFDPDIVLPHNPPGYGRVTRSFILLTNSGNKLIETSDLSGNCYIQCGSNEHILSANIVFADDPASRPIIGEPTENKASFAFDFLRPKDGLIIKIDHTGKPNELFLSLRTKLGGPVQKGTNNITTLIFLFGLLLFFSAIGGLFIIPELSFMKDITGDNLFMFVAGSVYFGIILTGAFLLLFVVALIAVQWLRGRNNRRAAHVFFHIALNRKKALS